MPPPPLRISLLLGSSRAKRIGASVAGHIKQRLVARGHEVHLLDPRASHDGYFMQLMEKAHFHYKEGEAVPPALDTAAAALRASDAFVVCTPEMNHTIAPALTNMMNYFGAKTYAYKPLVYAPTLPACGAARAVASRCAPICRNSAACL